MEQVIERPKTVFQTAQTYPAYLDMLNALLAENKTTGPNQSEDYINYAKQNLQRKKRTTKTFKIDPDHLNFLQNLTGNYQWLVITEGWCGDAATIVPVLAEMANLSDQIELRVTLRDEHPTLMDQFLTNGGRSIPILIFMNADTGEVLGHWGPRPEEAQQLMIDMKAAENPHADISYNLQKWYAKDKSQTTIDEVIEALKELEG